MTHFELKPFQCEPDGYVSFPNSYKVYDTFRGRIYMGTVLYMTKLKMFRTIGKDETSVYTSAEDMKALDGRSIESEEMWKGDIPYKDTDCNAEAAKLYKIHWEKLEKKERTARILDKWWPVCIGFWAILEGVLALIEIAKNVS